MTDDLNIWLEGAPVIPMPGGESLEIWLEGAPVVTLGGDSVTASVSGTEIITETGTVTATGGIAVTVTGSEVVTETGTVEVIGVFSVTGSEVLTETGTVTASGGSVAEVTGSECETETGIVGVTIIPPIPPTPVPTGGAKTHSRVLQPWDFEPRKKKRPERYRRRKKEQSEDEFEVDLPEIPVTTTETRQSTVVARVHGSEISSKTGRINVKIDRDDDAETIKLIMEVLEMADAMPDEVNRSNSVVSRSQSKSINREEEELELILMLSEEF